MRKKLYKYSGALHLVYPIEVVEHVIGEYRYSETIYNGWITIPENSKVQAVINRHKMLNINSITEVSGFYKYLKYYYLHIV